MDSLSQIPFRKLKFLPREIAGSQHAAACHIEDPASGHSLAGGTSRASLAPSRRAPSPALSA